MTLWLAWREQLRLREWQEFSNALKEYEDLLNEHYYGDSCTCLVCSQPCPLCGEKCVGGVCPWENYTQEDFNQAMDIDAVGGGVHWAESVLIHEHEDYVKEIHNE